MRLPYLKSEVKLESVLSRESSFPLQQLDSAGELLCCAVGNAFPCRYGSPHG